MELILRSDNEQGLAKILALTKKLNVIIEQREPEANQREKIKSRILNFKTTDLSSFGDAQNWQVDEQKDRNILNS